MTKPRAPVSVCICGKTVTGKRIKLDKSGAEENRFECPDCKEVWFE